MARDGGQTYSVVQKEKLLFTISKLETDESLLNLEPTFVEQDT